VVEGAHYVCAQHQGQTLHAIEIGVLDAADAVVSKELLWNVIHQLSVDKHIDPVISNLLALGLCSQALSSLYLFHLLVA
jgi:hypothetical protein